MNLLDLVLNNSGAVQQMARQFGLGEDQAQSALSAVLPALAGAVRQNASDENGLGGLLGALASGNHQRYLDDPSFLGSQEAVQDGNGILGHLLGSPDVSRQLAQHASAQTGVGTDIIKKMLPMAAGLLMGGLSRGSSAQMGAGAGGGLLGAGAQMLAGMMGGGQPQQSTGSGILGMLTPLIDQNRDGSAMDDVLGMAARFLTQR